jgi:uncharacterized protein (DUF58 family)
MISGEILKKIQEIKIRTRRVMNGTLVGGQVTKQKGSGFEFDQIRSYNYGDDIRFVDWNSSARYGNLLVRQYLDDKNRNIILCLDISASTIFASQQEIVSDVMQQITAALSYIGQSEKDNIGLILFSDKIEKFIAPSSGSQHMMYVMETIFSYKAKNIKTDFNVLCNYLIESFIKEAAIIIISDFIADDFDKSLKKLVCKREVIAIRCLDKIVRNIPAVGYLWGQDPETQSSALLHISTNNALEMQKVLQDRINKQDEFFRKCRIDIVDISTDDNFMQTLIVFFKRRMVVP